MQGLRSYPNDVVHLDLTPPSSSTTTNLSIDGEESAEAKIQRLISEHPVIIFSRSSCCMCHVMRKLLATIGVHPTVIELDDHEISALPLVDQQNHDNAESPRNPAAAPAVFIGGTCVGGLDSLFALHLSGHLVPKLVEVGALWRNKVGMSDDQFRQLKEDLATSKFKRNPFSFGFGDDDDSNISNPQPHIQECKCVQFIPLIDFLILNHMCQACKGIDFLYNMTPPWFRILRPLREKNLPSDSLY